MQKIYHKRNELLEVEFFKDYDCKIPFDFTNAKNLYIELKAGDLNPFLDITPFLQLYPYTEFCNLYLPYFPNVAAVDFLPSFENIYTLDDITPNLSKYIPEDNAVLFLSSEDCKRYMQCFQSRHIGLYANDGLDKVTLEGSVDAINEFSKNPIKKLTIFLSRGTKSELQKANEVAKELKEKHGIEKVSVFMLSCFIRKHCLIATLTLKRIETNGMYHHEISGYRMVCKNIDKIITTNSTGLLEPENNENLQVIDCFDIFNDSIGLTTDETIIKSTNNIGGILQKLADR